MQAVLAGKGGKYMLMLVCMTFAQFLPFVFILACVGIVWDKVISAFRGGSL